MNSIGRTEINTTPNYQVKAQLAKQETKAPELKPVTASADQAMGNYGKAMLQSQNAHNLITSTRMDGNNWIIKYADGTERNLGKTKTLPM